MADKVSDIEFEFAGYKFTINPATPYHCNQTYTTTNFTPLMYLIMHSGWFGDHIDYESELRKFISNNKNYLDAQNTIGLTALILICVNSYIDKSKNIIQILIDAKCDLNKQNACGYTALMNACFSGNITTTNMLITAGADINLQDNYGDTVFMSLCSRNYVTNHKEILKLLIDADADLHITNKKQKSGFELMCEFTNEDMIRYYFNKSKNKEVELVKCIKTHRYQNLLTKLLTEFYCNKVAFFKLY